MLQSVTDGYNSISLADKLIGKVIVYGGLQIRTSLPHGLQPTNERRAEGKLAYAMPCKEEEDDSQIPADKIVKTITKTKTKTE